MSASNFGAKGCTCTMGQSLNGDGCRHCQPQTTIDKYEDIIQDLEQENSVLLVLCKAITKRNSGYNEFHDALAKLTMLVNDEVGNE